MWLLFYDLYDLQFLICFVFFLLFLYHMLSNLNLQWKDYVISPFQMFLDFMKSWGMSPVLKTCGEVWLNLLNKGNLRQKSFFQQEINYLAAVSYKFLWEVPSKLEIQCKKGMYFYLILVGILWTKSAKRDENYFLMVLYCFSLLMSYLSPPLIGLITDLLLLC